MSDIERAEQPSPLPVPAGERLRAAREGQGMALAAVADRTRVPLRHLEAIEAGDYASLPSPTYATGFARAYARAVGIDEVGIARDVRAEAAKLGRRQPEYEPYVTADPARVPSRGLVIVTAGIALAVIVLAALWIGTGWSHRANAGAGARAGAGAVGSVTSPAPARARASGPSGTAAVPATARQVTLIANDTIWLRVYDAADKTLFLGTMKPGDRFDVPPGADHPKINVGRADKLAVTLDGKPVAALGTGERPIKNVPVDAASLARRPSAPTAVVTPSANPSPGSTRDARGAPSPRPTSRPRKPRMSQVDETERANRRSARAAERGEVPSVPAPSAGAAATPSDGARP